MSRTTFRSGVFSALSIGALVVTGGLVTGGAADSTGVDSWVVPQTQQAGEYWTAERMKAALPGDSLVAGKVPSGASESVAAGRERTVPKQNARPVKPGATAQTPVAHIGKVFFTFGGSNYVCSANAISSANESTVATAGHCLNEGPGTFATRFTFVPAYQNGSAPYGQWTATELHAPTNWTSGGDITYDTGFAVVSSPTGVSLSDTVGASGVAFNDSRGLTYSAFGYPAASPFTGETLQSCYGTATNDPYGQSESQGIPCNMTGGSSGGPWFIGSSSAGVQNSLSSFGSGGVKNTMFGPYWGAAIASVYDSASS